MNEFYMNFISPDNAKKTTERTDQKVAVDWITVNDTKMHAANQNYTVSRL